MTRRERLIENYEDALFSLLMDEVAESEGKKAMEGNQRLRDNGEIEVPVSVRQRCRRVIAKRAVENDLRQFGHGVTRILTKVAVVALVGMLLFTTAFAASEDFRLKTLNFVMETFDDRIELKLISDDMSPYTHANGVPEFTVGWLPEGFELTMEESNDFSAWKEYSADASDVAITIFVTDLSTGESNFDIETTEKVLTKVNGMDAFYIADGDIIQVVWGYGSNSQWLYYITGTHINIRTALDIAESII